MSKLDSVHIIRTFAELLEELRASRGLSLRELEGLSGVSFSQLSKIERKETSKNSEEVLQGLARAFDLNKEEFVIATNRNSDTYFNYWLRQLAIKVESDTHFNLSRYLIRGKLNLFRFNLDIMIDNETGACTEIISSAIVEHYPLTKLGYTIEEIENMIHKYNQVKKIVNK